MGAPFVETLPRRSPLPLYTPGCSCPGCGLGHWHVGRNSAECAFCTIALPLRPARKGGAA